MRCNADSYPQTRLFPASTACVRAGDNTVDSVDLRRFCGLERPDRPEARSPLATELIAGNRDQLVERLADRILEQLRRGVGIRVRAVGRLRNDRVDDAELETVDGVRLERSCSLTRLP